MALGFRIFITIAYGCAAFVFHVLGDRLLFMIFVLLVIAGLVSFIGDE